MKLKKTYLLTMIVSFIVFVILFYPRILPPIDARSTTSVLIKNPETP